MTKLLLLFLLLLFCCLWSLAIILLLLLFHECPGRRVMGRGKMGRSHNFIVAFYWEFIESAKWLLGHLENKAEHFHDLTFDLRLGLLRRIN